MSNNSFYSIDRLIEFGLGLNVAQQMIRSMNESINNMTIPGEQRLNCQKSLSFYLAIGEKPAGPFCDTDVAILVANGTMTKESLVWKQGMPMWKKVEEVPDILRLIALSPPPIPKTGEKNEA